MNHISAKISVIIPVYNVEKYLNKCLDSVINQSLQNIEIICINDGSTDNSLEILKYYEIKDSRIKVISKENGGQSSARNMGLNLAIGEYISFVDSDDWIDIDFLEKLYNNAVRTMADIIMCSAKVITKEDKAGYFDNWINNTIGRINNDVFFDIVTKKTSMDMNVIWNKIYLRSFLIENKLFFFEGLYWEDNPFVIMSTIKANKISIIRDALYFYNIHEKGTTGTAKFDRKPFDMFEIVERLAEWFKINELNKIPEYKYFFAETMYSLLMSAYCRRLHNKYKKEFFKKMKKTLNNLLNEDEKVYLKKTSKEYRLIVSTNYFIHTIYSVYSIILSGTNIQLRKIIKFVLPKKIFQKLKSRKKNAN